MTTPTPPATTPFLLGRFVSITNEPLPNDDEAPARPLPNDDTTVMDAHAGDVTRMFRADDLLAAVPAAPSGRAPVVPAPPHRRNRRRVIVAIVALVLVMGGVSIGIVALLSARESAAASEAHVVIPPRPGSLGRFIPADGGATEPSTMVTTTAPPTTTAPVVERPVPAPPITRPIPTVPRTVPTVPTLPPTATIPTIPPTPETMPTVPPTIEPPIDTVPDHPEPADPCGPDAPPEC